MTSVVDLQSASSEVLPGDLPNNDSSELRRLSDFQKIMCSESKAFGIKSCTELKSSNIAFIRNCTLYTFIGKHSIMTEVSPGKLMDDVAAFFYLPFKSRVGCLVAIRHFPHTSFQIILFKLSLIDVITLLL